MARILIIEDNPADSYLIQEALNSAGVQCSTQVIGDGESALHLVSGPFAQDAVPDLILMDLNLPKGDAAGLLAAIRRSTQLGSVPVAILTSSEAPGDRTELKRLGATAHLVKPPNLDEFLSLGQRFKELLAGGGTGGIE